LLTDRLQAPRRSDGRYLPHPAVDSYLALVRHLGCPVGSTRLELFTTEEERRLADRVWSELGLPDDRSVVCLNNGGAFGPAKSWPVEYFATLARRLATEAGRAVLVLCGPSERAAARAIVAAAEHPRVVSLADHAPSIGLSKASLQRSALLVTTDSGPRHLATAFRVPVVTLFGPTFIAWTRTNHPCGLNLQQPVPCGPCQKPVCPEGHHRCMKELEPDVVFDAALRLLGMGHARCGLPASEPVGTGDRIAGSFPVSPRNGSGPREPR
jgi:heptosyltransferase-2